jgi:hypothetical protein
MFEEIFNLNFLFFDLDKLCIAFKVGFHIKFISYLCVISPTYFLQSLLRRYKMKLYYFIYV